jgi:parvulin-like peptidyl-prolyl isomerase
MGAGKMKTVFVNGVRVNPDDVAEQRKLMEESYRERLPADEAEARLDQDALDNVIDQMLLAQAAQAAKCVVQEAEVKRRFNQLKQDRGGPAAFYASTGLTRTDDAMIREKLRERLGYEKYIEGLGRDQPRPGDDECRAAYERDPDRFVVPEMVLASHILLKPGRGVPSAVLFAELLNIRQAILDGADFAAVAREVSDDPDNGGSLGYFPRGKMVPAFDRAAFALEPGEVSDVVQTEYGYHLIKVFDRRATEARDFASVREIIRAELWEARKDQRVGEEADALRAAAEIREVED